MAWIESHQTLARHPKTLRLAEELGCSVPCAIGHLHLFWWWALEYARQGRFAMTDALAIEAACMWHRRPNESRSNPLPSRFLSALEAAVFVNRTDSDGYLIIHDWMDYAGRWVEKREQNAARMRAKREAVQRTVHARAGATGPNLTGPNRTVPNPPLDPPQDENARAVHTPVRGTFTCCVLADVTSGQQHSDRCPSLVQA